MPQTHVDFLIERNPWFQIIPRGVTSENIRSVCGDWVWEQVRCEVARGGSKCYVCGETHRIHRHEEWQIQYGLLKLLGVMNLCAKCHRARHGTFADAWLYYKIDDGAKWKFKKYAELVGIDKEILWAEYEWEVQNSRAMESCKEWIIDVSLLKDWRPRGVFPYEATVQ